MNCPYCNNPAREHKHSGKCLSCGAPMPSSTPAPKGGRVDVSWGATTTVQVPNQTPMYVTKDELYSIYGDPRFIRADLGHILMDRQIGYYAGKPVILRD